MFDGEDTVPAETAAADAAFDKTVDAALSGEAPTEAASAPAAEPAAPAETAPVAQPRDEQGRFSAKPPAAEPAPEAQAPAEAPEARTEPTEEAGAEPKPDAEAEAAPRSYPEAAYRYDGADVAIPGSAVGEDGAFIPTAQWPDVQRYLAAGRSALEGSIRQRLGEAGEDRARSQKQVEAALAARDHIFAAIDEMVEKETFGDFLQDLAANWRVLKAEAVSKSKDLELAEERRQRETREQEAARQQREPQMRRAVEQYVAHFGQPAGLDAEAQRQLAERLNGPRFRQLIFTQAADDNPVDGTKKGDWLVDYGVIEDEVQFFVRAGGGRKPAADRVKELERENARRMGKPSPAPPTAGARRGPAPAPAVKIPDFKSAEEADEAIWDKDGYKNLGG